jgi:hypothetical protein
MTRPEPITILVESPCLTAPMLWLVDDTLRMGWRRWRRNERGDWELTCRLEPDAARELELKLDDLGDYSRVKFRGEISRHHLI